MENEFEWSVYYRMWLVTMKSLRLSSRSRGYDERLNGSGSLRWKLRCCCCCYCCWRGRLPWIWSSPSLCISWLFYLFFFDCVWRCVWAQHLGLNVWCVYGAICANISHGMRDFRVNARNTKSSTNPVLHWNLSLFISMFLDEDKWDSFYFRMCLYTDWRVQ